MFSVTLPSVVGRARGAAPAATRAALAGTRVLLVDNDPQALAALARLLGGWGCEVVTAVDDASAAGGAARRATRRCGCSTTTSTTATPAPRWPRAWASASARARRVILSADTGEAVRRAVHEAGLPLLAKPMKPLALKSVLDRLLAAREVQSAAAAQPAEFSTPRRQSRGGRGH